MTAEELKAMAASGHMTRSLERAYHRAWARGEIHSDWEPDRGPLPWTIRFNRRFIRLTYARVILLDFIERCWPIMAGVAAIFFAGFLAGRYL